MTSSRLKIRTVPVLRAPILPALRSKIRCRTRIRIKLRRRTEIASILLEPDKLRNRATDRSRACRLTNPRVVDHKPGRKSRVLRLDRRAVAPKALAPRTPDLKTLDQ
jgi:hypothetical protein